MGKEYEPPIIVLIKDAWPGQSTKVKLKMILRLELEEEVESLEVDVSPVSRTSAHLGTLNAEN